jgi:hypothetical protein
LIEARRDLARVHLHPLAGNFLGVPRYALSYEFPHQARPKL